MPTVLGLGEIWIALIVALPIVVIILVVYSVWQLRKEENWEQR